MAESTEDLRREMEEFEREEATPVVETPGAPAPRRIPTWVYWMVAVDLIVAVAVVLLLVAL